MMKLGIVKGGNGSIFVIYILLVTASCVSILEDVRNVHDLCRSLYNAHIYNVEENSSFQLILNSDAPSNNSDKLLLQKLKKKCSLTLKLCSSCHLSIFIKNMTIPSCSSNCSCNYFEIKEPLSDYESKKYCGNYSSQTMYFESKTKIVSFDFVQSVHKMFYVSLNFNVSRNLYIFTGMPIEDLSHPKYIESPNFPVGYPSDYGAEYVFQAFGSMRYVRLLFLDFQLSQWSYIEVTGHNGSHTEVFNGIKFRPPAIISQGSSLKLRFQANDQPPSRGFRAMYVFAKHVDNDLPEKPYTNCGGSIDSYGGTITISVPKTNEQLFDCLWIILPPILVQASFSLSALVLEFKNIGLGSFLEFRQGLTSKSRLIKEFHCDHSLNCSAITVKFEVIVPASSGFYIRFRGYLSNVSSVVIPYSMFKTNNCTTDEFVCGSQRCIKNVLVCDGYSHCPDGSDELKCTGSTNSTSVPSGNVNWHPRHPPFQKEAIFPGATGFIMFTIVGVCGLFTFMFIIVISLLNWYKQRYRVPDPAQHLHIVNETAGVIFADNSTAPASIDQPPSYEDVIKYNELFPPLFYTRTKDCAETSCSTATFFKGNSQPNCASGNQSQISISSSEFEIFSHNLSELGDAHDIEQNCASVPVKANCSLCSVAKKSNLRTTVLGSLVCGKLIRPRSYDSTLNKFCNSGSMCSCNPYTIKCDNSTSEVPNKNVYSKSLPSNYKFCLLENEDASSSSESCSSQEMLFHDQSTGDLLDENLTRRSPCSFTASFSGFNSEIISSFKAKCLSNPVGLHCMPKRKTLSF